MTAWMHLYCNSESGNPQHTIFLVTKITFKQIVKVLSQRFWKGLKQHWGDLFESDFADLGHVFVHWVG